VGTDRFHLRSEVTHGPWRRGPHSGVLRIIAIARESRLTGLLLTDHGSRITDHDPCAEATMATDDYDLILRGGDVLDPASGPRRRADLAVSRGRIAAGLMDAVPQRLLSD